ncbi:hypothetical protein PSHT_01271 [Puccinia striiformis]|uniref:Uncharacterized protein n=1 Tax=Puccinia striiformis TaxID=27350 RepID=A0A2S4WKY5_9BASI|nr:hypothetical protein PSHT_01271 [Puccinia striiformis]
MGNSQFRVQLEVIAHQSKTLSSKPCIQTLGRFWPELSGELSMTISLVQSICPVGIRGIYQSIVLELIIWPEFHFHAQSDFLVESDSTEGTVSGISPPFLPGQRIISSIV